jgi:UDP-N-acetylmuramate dehydrogenase
MISLSDLRSFFHGSVHVNEPMEKYSWMRVGGPADFFLEPSDRDDLVALIQYLRSHHVPLMLIGRGSNMLISDAGVRGAVINVETCLSDIRRSGELVVADAGVRLTKFVEFCVQEGFAGVEMLAGIPGTIGGAVMMNAGAHGGEIADHIVDVEVIRDGERIRVMREDAKFAYRQSGFAGDVILEASFRLPAGDREEMQKRRREMIIKRNQTQPLDSPNLGSMFKNVQGTYAAKLIEECGLKGTTVGGAQVSQKHANFMINTGNAKASDVFQLIQIVRATVREQRGIGLELEVKLVGFSKSEMDLVA